MTMMHLMCVGLHGCLKSVQGHLQSVYASAQLTAWHAVLSIQTHMIMCSLVLSGAISSRRRLIANVGT